MYGTSQAVAPIKSQHPSVRWAPPGSNAYYRVPEADLNAFVRFVYGGVYCFSVNQSLHHPANTTYHIDGFIRDYHHRHVESIRAGQYPVFSTFTILSCLCHDKYILPGTYEILGCPAPLKEDKSVWKPLR